MGLEEIFDMIGTIIEVGGNILNAWPYVIMSILVLLLVVGLITSEQAINSVVQQGVDSLLPWWTILVGHVPETILAFIIVVSTIYAAWKASSQ